MLFAEHLTRRFGDRLALDDVSFEVRAGEILALLGPNGAGKTTTLRILCGLIAPTSGKVRLADRTLTPESGAMRADIGLLTESPGLWDRLSVRTNLLTYARLYSVSDPARAVDETLRLLQIEDRAEQIAAQLSKGLRQRVALARALVHNPRVLLLDEPTSGLDPESAREVRGVVMRLRREGRAILLSTHNLDEVDRIADRIAILRTQLIAIDTPERLRAHSRHKHVRITIRGGAERFVALIPTSQAVAVRASGSELLIALPTDSTEALPSGSTAALPTDVEESVPSIDIPQIVRTLVEGGAEIEAVVADAPSLEDTYLRLLQSERHA
jgi:ABC-2 type transport system ATP-binding protein